LSGNVGDVVGSPTLFVKPGVIKGKNARGLVGGCGGTGEKEEGYDENECSKAIYVVTSHGERAG
jgi:hypothetical protein